MPTDLGDVVPLSVQIRDAAGDLADAGAVTLTVTTPDGTGVPVPVLRASAGTYSAQFTPTMPGLHQVYWQATGANASAFHDAFTVADPVPPLVGLDDIKNWLNKDQAQRATDEELRTVIAAATSLAEGYCHRALRPSTWTGTITATGPGGVLMLPRPAATSILAVTNPSGADVTATVEMDRPAAGSYLRAVAGTATLSGSYTVTVRLGVTGADLDIAQQGVRELVRHMWAPQRAGAPLPLQAAASEAARPATAHALPWLVTEKLDQIRLDI